MKEYKFYKLLKGYINISIDHRQRDGQRCYKQNVSNGN